MHCDGDQVIYTYEGDNLGQIRAAVENQGINTFTAWFNSNNPAHIDYNASGVGTKYTAFPEYFTWNKKKWKPRKQGFSIGRMYFVTSRDKDRYYLRLLLLHRSGIISFKDMRTVDETLYPTYQATALALGLLETNEEYDRNLADAAEFSSTNGNQLRCFFVSMMINCNIPDRLCLYMKHNDKLKADFDCQFPNESTNENRALCSISSYLQQNGYTLADFQLPTPNVAEVPAINGSLSNWDLNEQTMFAKESLNCLNSEHKPIYDDILEAARQSTELSQARLFFLDGPGGTGKSYLIKAILATLWTEAKHPIVVASSEIASLSFEGGATAHTSFRIPIDIDTTSTCNISHRSDIADTIRNSCLVIWAEARMMPIRVLMLLTGLSKTF